MSDTKVQRGIELVDTMDDNELNALVDYIRDSYKSRRLANNAKARATLKVGDKVRLGSGYKPQYLNGLTGEIVEKRQTRVVVLLDCGPVGKFRNGRVITSPASISVIPA